MPWLKAMEVFLSKGKQNLSPGDTSYNGGWEAFLKTEGVSSSKVTAEFVVFSLSWSPEHRQPSKRLEGFFWIIRRDPKKLTGCFNGSQAL